MTSPTRIRPRLTAPPAVERVESALPLSDAGERGLARISGGRPLEELVVLATAAALVVSAAEDTSEPAVGVEGPAGPVVFSLDVTAQASITELVRGVDSALRQAPPERGGAGPDLSEGLLVRSERVEPTARTGGKTAAALEVTVTKAGPDGGRVISAAADGGRVERWFLDVLLRALAAAVAAFDDPQRPREELPGAAAEDLKTAVRFGSGHFQDAIARTTLTAPVLKTVRERPDDLAVVVGKESLTYAEMWGEAERIAACLITLGVGPGDRVALLTGKSPHAVPAMLGTMLVRGIHVPLDVQSPPARLAEILADARCAAVLVTGDGAGRLPSDAVPIVDLDTAVSASAVLTLPAPPGPDDPAYLIYTSGSTGSPKGVEVSHGAIASHVRWKLDYYGLDSRTRTLQLPSLSFDSSMGDIFPTLSAGGCLVLADAVKLLPRQLAELVSRHRVTHMLVVPSLYRMLLPELSGVRESLQVITVAGEATTPDLVLRHHTDMGGIRLVNEYGPTENSVAATAFDQEADAGPVCPIGRPLPNTMVSVVGPDGRTRAPGFVGEIQLAGHGLANGYWNRPGQTAAAFVTDTKVPGSRRYRTGDLGWWRPDGILEFAGRTDGQVKVRGHRVELGEIESALSRISGVEAAVVVATAGPDGTASLTAFLTAEAGKDPLVAEVVMEAAATLLPPAMVPARLELIPELPLLLNGKPDRRELTRRAAAVPASGTPSPNELGGGSTDECERAITKIFEEVLGGGVRVGLDDDFFLLGGHSLMAVTAITRIEEELDVLIDLGEFFTLATVRAIADLIRAEEGASPAGQVPAAHAVEDPDPLLRLLTGFSKTDDDGRQVG
ncbi:non-ribosomal peptide synthetase [Streptomyces sp. NPDC026589]|uniref:non-ribosomal peptide synthetase n=1 Tax=Streptomyces sp. NPDC026589 TaxID=3155609 RepID=UPI0033E0CC39